MLMSAITDKCIFCKAPINPEKVPPEHIIPESIDGSVVAYNVCKKCNNKLGSKVDNELNKNHHIWDARKRHKGLPPPRKPFRFKQKYAIVSDGTKLPMVPKSDSEQIITHKLPNGGMIADRRCPPEKDPFIRWMDEERKKVGLSDEDFYNDHIKRYLKAREKGSYLGKRNYKDWLFTGMDVFFEEEKAVEANSIMVSTTPHRFIAKMCVEYSHLFNFENEIENLNDLKTHALSGGLEENKLRFYEEICEGTDAYPCHIIAFSDSQFIFGIYDIYFVGVDIKWRSEPKIFVYADDFVAEKLRICIEKNGTFEFQTERSFDFKEHDTLGRPTHIRHK